jgi:glutamate 5-kinase
VKTVQGTFQRGDTLAIVLEGSGAEIGRGLAGYDSGEAISHRRPQDLRNRSDPRLRAPRRDDPP